MKALLPMSPHDALVKTVDGIIWQIEDAKKSVKPRQDSINAKLLDHGGNIEKLMTRMEALPNEKLIERQRVFASLPHVEVTKDLEKQIESRNEQFARWEERLAGLKLIAPIEFWKWEDRVMRLEKVQIHYPMSDTMDRPIAFEGTLGGIQFPVDGHLTSGGCVIQFPGILSA